VESSLESSRSSSFFFFFQHSPLTQDHRVLSYDAHGEGALPNSLEGVLDLEPFGV